MDNEALRQVFIIIQIVATVISIVEVFYVAFQKPSNLQKQLLLLIAFVTISNAGYMIELMGKDIQTSYIGCCLGYASKPFSLIASLAVMLEYTNVHIKKRYIFALAVFFTFLSILVFTNRYFDHKLYYSTIGFNIKSPGSPLEVTHGVFWYVYMACSFLIFAAHAVLTFYEFKNAKTKTAKQMSILLFLVAFLSFLGLIIFLSGAAANYDTTLPGMMLGTIVLLVLFTRYNIFDNITEAKNKTLDGSEDGILVFDARMCLSYYNQTVTNFFPRLKENFSRKHEAKLIEELDNLDNGEPIFCNNKVYKLIVTDEISKKSKKLGKIYTFKEITEHYRHNEILKNEVEKTTKKLLGIQRSALISFANIVEARDGNTGAHIKNVSQICKMIAIALQSDPNFANEITDDFINILVECAPLHDVGKIYVPDAILLKPGKLTPAEFEIMKTHSERGAYIIDSSIKDIEEPEYVKIAREIALCHHERWDGTGYPAGLKGINIPLSARILAVADVYDALTMNRPYKEAFSKEKSVAIITEESGTHFDPRIVKAFLSIVNEI